MARPRFCGRCGGRLDSHADGALTCAACGRPAYENSKPCAGVAIERAGRVLLVRRAIEPFRGWWDIPGGFLEPGEHPAGGAIREAREETGLDVAVSDLLGIWMDTYGEGEDRVHTLNCYYLAHIIGGEPRAADDAAELGWFEPGKLPAQLAFAHAPLVLAAWRRRALTDRSDG
ncbi:MAG: NUDIX domain-containing protein [Chloroflexi bacterium]|nr:NUDIX domain-containing protein [Chloroflexota bacterium]